MRWQHLQRSNGTANTNCYTIALSLAVLSTLSECAFHCMCEIQWHVTSLSERVVCCSNGKPR